MSSSTNNGSEASIEAILNSIRQTASQDQTGDGQSPDGEAAAAGGAGSAYDAAPGHRSLTDTLHAAASAAEGGEGVPARDERPGPDWDRPQLVIGPLADLAGGPANAPIGGSGLSAADEHAPAAPVGQGSGTDDTGLGAGTASSGPNDGGDQVARQMVPFADTRMNRMGDMSPGQSAAPSPSTTTEPVAALSAGTQSSPRTSSPAQPTAPAPEAPNAAAMATPPPLGQQPVSPPVGSPAQASPPTNVQAEGGMPLSQNAHDAAAELLRPVLRQWVGENMPRIVEKALHIELAESIKKQLGPGEEK